MEMNTHGLYPATQGIWIEPKRRAPSIASAVVSSFISWRKTARRRRQMDRLINTLSLLDDRLLQDTGLHRHQIEEFVEQVYGEHTAVVVVMEGRNAPSFD